MIFKIVSATANLLKSNVLEIVAYISQNTIADK